MIDSQDMKVPHNNRVKQQRLEAEKAEALKEEAKPAAIEEDSVIEIVDNTTENPILKEEDLTKEVEVEAGGSDDETKA